MGIQAVVPVGRAGPNMVRGAFNTAADKTETSTQEKLIAFKYFPQPIFLIDHEMNVLEKNKQGRLAVENNWVGIVRNQLNFNSKENNSYVRKTIAHLDSAKSAGLSEKFALRSLDMVCRSFTVSSLSPMSSELLLTIQGDLSCTNQKMQSISRVFSLTTSETNIVKMMVTGLKPKEIAYEAGISLNTVRSHLRTLYAKMQVRSYNDALTQAIRLLV